MAAMTSRSDFALQRDDRILMNGHSWADYEAQVALRGENRRCPKLAFLDGVVELMSPSNDHERTSFVVGYVLVTYCVERGIPMLGYGSWRIGDGSKRAGAEPDECYIFGEDQGRRDRPDLVIEVIWTSGGLDKLEIYRRLGVPEVWFWDEHAISVHVLGPEGYEARARSTFVPELDLALVCELATVGTVNEIHKRLRAALAR
jgi:Uma2 family endonuclease